LFPPPPVNDENPLAKSSKKDAFNCVDDIVVACVDNIEEDDDKPKDLIEEEDDDVVEKADTVTLLNEVVVRNATPEQNRNMMVACRLNIIIVYCILLLQGDRETERERQRDFIFCDGGRLEVELESELE